VDSGLCANSVRRSRPRRDARSPRFKTHDLPFPYTLGPGFAIESRIRLGAHLVPWPEKLGHFALRTHVVLRLTT